VSLLFPSLFGFHAIAGSRPPMRSHSFAPCFNFADFERESTSPARQNLEWNSSRTLIRRGAVAIPAQNRQGQLSSMGLIRGYPNQYPNGTTRSSQKCPRFPQVLPEVHQRLPGGHQMPSGRPQEASSGPQKRVGDSQDVARGS